jgi:hypothetical protein
MISGLVNAQDTATVDYNLTCSSFTVTVHNTDYAYVLIKVDVYPPSGRSETYQTDLMPTVNGSVSLSLSYPSISPSYPLGILVMGAQPDMLNSPELPTLFYDTTTCSNQADAAPDASLGNCHFATSGVGFYQGVCEPPNGDYVILDTETDFYTEPDRNSVFLGLVVSDQYYQVLEQHNGWLRLDTDRGQGWIEMGETVHLRSPASQERSINACGNTYSRLQIGDIAQVDDKTPTPANMRSRGSLDATRIYQIPIRERVSIVGGPACADGWVWWEILYQGQRGWIAEVDTDGLYNLIFVERLVTVTGTPVTPENYTTSIYITSETTLYSEPSIHSAPLTTLFQSDPSTAMSALGVIGKNGNSLWLQLHLNRNRGGYIGWVCREYTQDLGDIFLVPVTDPSEENCGGESFPVTDQHIASTIAQSILTFLDEVPDLVDFGEDTLFVFEASTDGLTRGDVICLWQRADFFDVLLGTTISENNIVRAGDIVCTWGEGIGTLVMSGNPLGLVPILLEPDVYIDPWLDPLNVEIWKTPLTCRLFPDVEMCGRTS